MLVTKCWLPAFLLFPQCFLPISDCLIWFDFTNQKFVSLEYDFRQEYILECLVNMIKKET